MNNVSLPALVVLLALLGGSVRADNLVAFPQGSSAWTVDVTASPSITPGSAPKDPTQVTRLDVAQDGQKRRVEVALANGNTNEKWIIAATNTVLVKDPSGAVHGWPNGGDSALVFGVPFLEADFSWITAQHQVEKDPIPYGGKMCVHYKGKVTTLVPFWLKDHRNPGQPASHTVEAWIDSKTLLPVALDDSTSLAKYTFLPPPYPTLEVPKEYQATFNRLSH